MNVSTTRNAPVQSTQQPTQLQKNEQARAQTQRQQTEVKPAPPEPPKPVVNTQGQTTGRLLNVTA
ncbi:hypothetical protein [Rhodoferax sp.]|uniref:hypothetical protein n=1 Tax=Rhodoferax sp. TaxID=50421 RepID=UPI00263924B1|nr:hypothetical protein [Rhodoferax sp.]MDD2923849.1 hypothetical protein [Rhodoferax sp.]